MRGPASMFFCEKSLARDAAEIRPMVQICAEHGVKFGVAFMMRFHHMTVEAKRLVAKGAVWGCLRPGPIWF